MNALDSRLRGNDKSPAAFGLRRAFGIIYAKQRTLFGIAAANRRRGHRPIGLWPLARLHWMQQRLLDAYPPSN